MILSVRESSPVSLFEGKGAVYSVSWMAVPCSSSVSSYTETSQPHTRTRAHHKAMAFVLITISHRKYF